MLNIMCILSYSDCRTKSHAFNNCLSPVNFQSIPRLKLPKEEYVVDKKENFGKIFSMLGFLDPILIFKLLGRI